MEISEFAESLLLSPNIEAKLFWPAQLSDQSSKVKYSDLDQPGRDDNLKMLRGKSDGRLPSMNDLEKDEHRARMLHFFANHELLAIEIMALALIKFSDAPISFRNGIVQTIKEEQKHLKMYMSRLKELGSSFGSFELNDFFWHSMKDIASPMDYVCQMSLCFEQANLDYAMHYRDAFKQIGDQRTAHLLQTVLDDEIGHVGFGVKWFRTWKGEEPSDWKAFEQSLAFPFSPSRAKSQSKGRPLNKEARIKAGLNHDFINQLAISNQSKGRPPHIHIMNIDCEQFRAKGVMHQPNKIVLDLQEDLSSLLFTLANADDVLLIRQDFSNEFLMYLNRWGILPCETVNVGKEKPVEESQLDHLRFSSIKPWGYSPEIELIFKNIKHKITHQNKIEFDGLRELTKKTKLVDWRNELLEELTKSKIKPFVFSDQQMGKVCFDPQAVMEYIRTWSSSYKKFIIKAPFSTSGRDRIFISKEELDNKQKCEQISKYINQHEELLIEPWLDKQFEFSWQADWNDGEIKFHERIKLVTDLKGRYIGSECGAWHNLLSSEQKQFLMGTISPSGMQDIQNALSKVLKPKLQSINYTGPLGIDAFVYLDSQNHLSLHPMVEVNLKTTMGRVAHSLGKKIKKGRVGQLRMESKKNISLQRWKELQKLLLDEKAIERDDKSGLWKSGELILSDLENIKSHFVSFKII